MISLRLVAYTAGTDTRKGILPEPTSLSLSIGHNTVGALELTYSQLADQGSLLAGGLESGLEVAVEVNWGAGWTEPTGCRFLLIKRSTDPADPARMLRLVGPSYAWLAGRVRNLNLGAVEGAKSKHAGERKFASASAGRIVKTLLDEHQARRGDGVPLTRDGFSTTQDSAGASWSKTKTLYYPVGVDVLTVLTALSDIDHCDWRTQGRALQLWNADSHFTDRSSTVKLQIGRELGDAPSEETLEDLVTHILVRGEKKVKTTVQNTSGPHPWGYWEGFIDEGGIDTVAEAQDAAQKELADRSRVRGEYTRTLTLSDLAGDSLPFRDYLVGDWVTAPAVVGQQRMRVQQVTLTLDSDGKLGGSIVLNDRVLAAELKRASKLKSITITGPGSTGGSGITPIPEGPDPRQPAAPTGLAVTNVVYLDAFGQHRVRINASWAAVTTATDGTDLEIASYELWGQPQGHTPAAVWRRITSSTSTEAQWQPFSPGETWLFTVRALGVTTIEPGVQSAPVTVTMGHDTDPPPVPEAATVTADMGGMTIDWSGLAVGGIQMPPDFDHADLEVQVGAGPWLVRGRLTGRSSMSLTGLTYGVTHNVRLRAFDLTGNASGYSAVVSATPRQVVATDLDVVLPGDIAYSDVGNLIPDGSFENPVLSGQRLSLSHVGGWSIIPGTGAQHGGRLLICTADATSNKYQYLVDGAGGLVGEVLPQTPKIYVAFRTRTATGGATGTARLGARWRAQDDSFTYTYTNTVAAISSWQLREAVMSVPAGTKSVAFFVQVTDGTANWWFDTVVAREVIPTVLIEDLAVTDAKIASLAVNKLTAGEIAAGEYIRAGSASGPHARMDPTGFSAHAPNPAAAGAVQPFVRMGTADAGAAMAIGFDPADLEASISATGHAAVQSLRTNALSVGGSTLDEILAPLPRGIVAYTLRDTTVSGITTTETGIVELRATLQPGRIYEVSVTGMSIRSSVAGDVGEINIRVAYDGSAVSTSSASVRNGRMILEPTNVYTLQPGFTCKINSGAWGAAREVRLLLTCQRFSGTGTIDVWGSGSQPVILEIEDEGVAIDPSTTAIRRTTVWNCSGMYRKGTGSAVTSIALNAADPDDFIHGLFNSNGISGEGVTVATAVAGATLHKAEIGIYVSKSESGDPVGWYLNPRTNTSPAALGGTEVDHSTTYVTPPGFRWYDVSSGWTTAMRSVQLTEPNNRNRTVLNTSSHPLQLRLTYTR